MKKPPITISQSLIKEYLYKGDFIEHRCPRKIYVKFVLGRRTEPTLQNLKGLAFEYMITGNEERKVRLPRHKTTGKKLTSEIRLEQQAEIFKEWLRKRSNGKAVVNEVNSNIKIYKRFDLNRDVIISGELDIFPVPIYYPQEDRYAVSIIDVKYSGSIDRGFGRFNWGNAKYMDHIQAKMYLYLVRDIDYDLNNALNPGNDLRALTSQIREILDYGQCEFRYYIADDQPMMRKNVLKYTLKQGEITELNEDIRKVVNEIRIDNEGGWVANPGPQCFKDVTNGIFECPYYNCPVRKTELDINDY